MSEPEASAPPRPPHRVDLDSLQRRLSPAKWAERLAAAAAMAGVAARIEARIAAGETERGAIAAEAPEDAATTWVARLRRYRAEGERGLIDRRVLDGTPRKLTPEVLGVIRGILLSAPHLRSDAVHARLAAAGIEVSVTLVKRGMKEQGLSHPQGVPGHRSQVKVSPLGLAGAELLKAVDQHVGASASLVASLESFMEELSPPEGPVRDDREHRDARGRFEPAYNTAKPRTEPELGEKFDSVEIRREGKDLSAMRTANSSKESLFRKVRALVLLPCGTDSPRLEGLRHWQGDAFEALVGVAYMPSTLDKYTRELKYLGGGEVLRESVASFWLGRPGLLGESPVQGAAVVYVDTSVKPVWTHHFSQCAVVASLGGRVMPGTSTAFLHAGGGTPVLYQTWSGQQNLGQAVGGLLDQYEAVAGQDTVRRMVVMDREAHAAWLFKELRDRDWDFIVPLRKQVVGPKADFHEMTDWLPYQENGDEVCGGKLTLKDSKEKDVPIEVRVVGRRRSRTGKEAWYATLVAPEAFPNAQILDLYFARWPLQELVFKDGKGRTHLDAHHGYGRRMVDNVAVIDKLEKIEGQQRRTDARMATAQTAAAELRAVEAEKVEVIQKVDARLAVLRAALDEDIAQDHAGTQTFRANYATARAFETALEPLRIAARQAAQGAEKAERQHEVAQARAVALDADKARLERKRRIFTVDVELDEIMTAFKVTFMNLCAVFMTTYLGREMQLDTLIRSILTLPGERVRTQTTETIRIWRQPRDREAMPLVERACEKLTALGLRRGERRLRFELVDQQGAAAHRDTG
jgi:hypothetical protein